MRVDFGECVEKPGAVRPRPENRSNLGLISARVILLCSVFSSFQALSWGWSYPLNLVMKQFKLNVTRREATGRGPSRRLRAEGNIPANIYSKGKARSITVSAVAFRELNREIGGGAALIELTDDAGESALTHVQEVRHHPIKDLIEHIDFHEVARGESFVAHVPVHLNGEANAKGVKNEGGMIDHKAHEVEIRCRPSKLPDYIEVDVSGLEVHDAIHIRDLPELDGVEYLGNPDQVVVSCQPPTVAREATAEEEAEAVAADEVPASKVKEDEDSESDEK